MTRYRRAPDLVVYWRQTGPVAFSCRSGTRLPITPDVLAVLSSIPDWQTVKDVVATQPELGSSRDVKKLLDVLAVRRLVQRDSDRADEWLWHVWSPEAAFFHFGTRNPTSIRPRQQHERELREKARRYPQPAPTKSMRGPRILLPRDGVNDAFAATLRSRRTWRRFSSRPVTLDEIGSLLQLTFGVQTREWVQGQGPLVRKTSPSGGARH